MFSSSKNKILFSSVVKLGVSGGSLEVFQHDDYLGRKEKFTRSSNLISENGNGNGNWNNVISSVKAIKGNWILYKNYHYSGDHMLICEGEELSVLPYWNNKVSSVKYTEICGKNFLLR